MGIKINEREEVNPRLKKLDEVNDIKLFYKSYRNKLLVKWQMIRLKDSEGRVVDEEKKKMES